MDFNGFIISVIILGKLLIQMDDAIQRMKGNAIIL
jgi:hypothetical protein